MKKHFLGILIAMGCMGLMACARKGSSPEAGVAKVEPGALAQAQGGNSGGGGNTLLSTPIQEKDLAEALKNIKPIMVAAFRQLEALKVVLDEKVNDPNAADIYKEQIKTLKPTLDILFENGFDSIHKILAGVEVSVLDVGSCVHNGTENDGGADLSNKKICISKERLLAKLKTADYYSQIAALMFHEVGHLAGLDEDGAVVLQKFSLEVFDNKTIQAIPGTLQLQGAGIRAFSYHAEQILYILDHSKKGDKNVKESVCVRVGYIDGNHVSFLQQSQWSPFNRQLGLLTDDFNRKYISPLSLAIQASRAFCQNYEISYKSDLKPGDSVPPDFQYKKVVETRNGKQIGDVKALRTNLEKVVSQVALIVQTLSDQYFLDFN